MAFQAPTHAVGFGVVDDFHVVDVAVASDATDSAIHVNRVIEVDVVRGFMNPDPRNRIARLPRLANCGKLGTLGFDLSVAVHAGLGGWNIGVGGFFNSRMAVTTIHAELIHVEGVIKGYGLGGLVSHPGVFWSEVVGHTGNDASHHHCQTDKNLDGQPVGVAGENIGHGGVRVVFSKRIPNIGVI
jgi:hypothetical protein